MQLGLMFQLLLLVVVANGTPILAKRLWGRALSWPIDAGAVLADGQPLLGKSKTIRGLVLCVLVTPLAAVLVGLSWQVGLLIGISAMAGDLASSFLKRRMGLPPSSKAMGLDQIPESALPLFTARLLLPVSVLDILVGTMLFFFGSLLASRVMFKLGLRDKPY
jgi:hypothetical protein